MRKELFTMSVSSIRAQGRRTWLTMIGIFIGIAAVVALISLGQGLEDAIEGEFAKIGADKLFINAEANNFGTAGGSIPNPLTLDDLEVIEQVRGIQEVAYFNVRSARMEVGEDVGFYFVGGLQTGEEYRLLREFITVDLVDGRELRSGDGNSVIVGADYTRDDVFLEPVQVGDRITINEKKFTVIGILEPVGNQADDRTVYMPLEVMNELFDIDDETDIIVARIAPNEEPSLVGEEVERALIQFRDLDEEDKDFTVQTPEDLLASFGTILTIVQVVLTGIAAISLLVGAVNITNTMYTSVLERTKEIGIMKAIGASPATIQQLFLIESGLLGVAGGIIGMIFGALLAKGVQFIGTAVLRTELLQASLPPQLLIGAVLFSGLVGMVSGYFPARGAANQDAVESLRYE